MNHTPGLIACYSFQPFSLAKSDRIFFISCNRILIHRIVNSMFSMNYIMNLLIFYDSRCHFFEFTLSICVYIVAEAPFLSMSYCTFSFIHECPYRMKISLNVQYSRMNLSHFSLAVPQRERTILRFILSFSCRLISRMMTYERICVKCMCDSVCVGCAQFFFLLLVLSSPFFSAHNQVFHESIH